MPVVCILWLLIVDIITVLQSVWVQTESNAFLLLLTSSYLSRICVTMYDNMLCLFYFRIVLRMRNMNCPCFGLCTFLEGNYGVVDLIQLVNCCYTNTVTRVLGIRITKKGPRCIFALILPYF